MLELYYGKKKNLPKELTVLQPSAHFAHLSSKEYQFYNEDTLALNIRSQLKNRENLNWRWAIRDVTSMSLSMKAALMAYYFSSQKNIAVDLTECSEGAIEALLMIGGVTGIRGYINAPIPLPVTYDKVVFNGKETLMRKVAKEISGRRYYKATPHVPFAAFDIRFESDPYENGGKGRFLFEMTVKRQVTFVENTNLDIVTWLEMLRSFCNLGRYGELSLESTHALDKVKICGSERLVRFEIEEPEKEYIEETGQFGIPIQEQEIWFIGCVDSRKKSEVKFINKLIRSGRTVILFCRAGQYIKAPGGIERALLETARTADGISMNRIISKES